MTTKVINYFHQEADERFIQCIQHNEECKENLSLETTARIALYATHFKEKSMMVATNITSQIRISAAMISRQLLEFKSLNIELLAVRATIRDRQALECLELEKRLKSA